jgi:zinc protease
MKSFVWVIGFLFCMGSAQAAPEPLSFRLPEPLVETLPNGMKIAWFVDDKLPLVDLSLLVESGTRYDPAGKSGTVELTSRLLERGSGGLAAQEMARRVERLGASGAAGADEEGISVSMHGLSQDADELLEILALMVLRPNFREDEFAREKRRVEESWRHLADSAEVLSGFAFGRAILGGTPYARGNLQDLKNLRAVKLQDVRAFHRAHFVPKNAILVVVGRVDRAAYRTRIDRLFGAWSGALPKKVDVIYRDPRFAAKKGPGDEVLLVDRPDLPQAQLRLGFPIPGLRSKSRYSLAVANALLGEYFNSRLNLVVRDRMGLAYGIESHLTYMKDASFLSIASATAAPNAGKLLEETIRQLRLVRAGDILKEEVDVSKDFLLGGFPLGLSTLGAVATRWLHGYTFNLGPDYLNSFIPKIAAVSRESVLAAISEAFTLERMIIVISGDAKAIEKSLRERGFKKIRKVKARSLI